MPATRERRAWWLWLLWALPSPAAAGLPPEEASRGSSHEEALSRLRERESSVLGELDGLEQRVRTVEEAARASGALAGAAGIRAEQAERDEAGARARVEQALERLAPRLRARDRLSRRPGGLLVPAGSAADLLRHLRALDALLRADLELLAEARAAVDLLRERRGLLLRARDEAGATVLAASQQLAEAVRRKQELAEVLRAVLAERELREKALEELARQRRRLSGLVGGLARDSGEPAGPFARLKGRLPFPAAGFIEVGYGRVLEARFGTVTFHNGVDIRAPLGTDVRAVAGGRVVHAGPFRGYGNLLILEHVGGYHTLYAHLDALARGVGDEVEQGDLVGRVGETGSLKGAYLYFEVREKGGPVDPKDWLGAPR